MIYKIVLTVSGTKFFPDNVLEHLAGDFLIADMNSPGDKAHKKLDFEYGFGSISFFHPRKFAEQTQLVSYEEWFINFLLDNYELFEKNGVEDYEFFIEVYHNDDQCNFEIFSKDLLKKISHITLSFPVSTYLLKTDEFEQWANEIDAAWNNC